MSPSHGEDTPHAIENDLHSQRRADGLSASRASRKNN
jgi:hypothetical protein